MKKLFVGASILCADLGRLAEEAKRAAACGADALHIDIMDGHFVRNFSLGPAVVAALNRSVDLFLDVHLMIYHPFDYVERFVEAGADRIIFHFEATESVEDMIDYIRRCNVLAGLAFNPETSFSMVPKYIGACDLLLLMAVHPGFGGQAFLPEVLEKIRQTRARAQKMKIDQRIQVDGGINLETGKQAVLAGADELVSGTFLFGKKEMKEGIRSLKGLSL